MEKVQENARRPPMVDGQVGLGDLVGAHNRMICMAWWAHPAQPSSVQNRSVRRHARNRVARWNSAGRRPARK